MTARPIVETYATPWYSFRGDASGAWLLHPADLHALDPVVLVDHFRMSTPTFRPHPHAGFSAVTYLFEDSEDGFVNRDSLGHRLDIAPGSLHWTQAGSGVLHEEIPRVPGRVSHGLQIFVNSAAANKASAPAVFHRSAAEIAATALHNGGRVRVVIGEFGGHAARIGAHTAITLLDIALPAGAALELPVAPGERAFAVVARGSLAGTATNEPHAVRFADAGENVRLEAGAAGVHLAFFAGMPLGEPIVPKGPFIANTAAEASEMVRRFQAGQMGALAPTPGAFA
jgi:redox-sensitive bicupin YhaK (pirin superfamily)